MWICFMLFGAVVSVPIDEFMNIIKEKETIEHILPDYSSSDFDEKIDIQFSDLYNDKDNELYNTFEKYVQNGSISKGLTFNIYNDECRNATVALFRLLNHSIQTDKNKYDKLKQWAKDNVNDNMLDYALRLTHVFGDSETNEEFLPPFVYQPNLFISGDAIMKALKYYANNGEIHEDIKKAYQILEKDKNDAYINTNYSLCNFEQDLCSTKIKYFTEDVALNSYYYGVHLLHPFWMSNEELNKANPNHAALYYFVHQQLYTRYLLEKEHIDPTLLGMLQGREPDYQPGLYYENGLSFPTRTVIVSHSLSEDVSVLKNIDMAIRECMERGIIKAENGSWIRVTEDNYINMLTNFIRIQVDNEKVAKMIRSVFGYAMNGYPMEEYTPAPSAMHHPQTALREPIYWILIKKVVDYILLFRNNTNSYELSKYETNDYKITSLEVPRIETIFDYYMTNLYYSLVGHKTSAKSTTLNIYSRQRRLNHKPFEVVLKVHSKTDKDVVIRIFLGPECAVQQCWAMYYRFFQLDCFKHKLQEGPNVVTWSPDTSSKYSSDKNFNNSAILYITENYDIFKFPKNLAIPKGREEGLNFTMFLMILEDEETHDDFMETSTYMKITDQISNRPLGFPFHEKVNVESVNSTAPNYIFQNITVFHIKEHADGSGYFSPYLY